VDPQRRNLILGGVAAGLIVLAVILLVVIPRGKAELPQEKIVHGVCLACREHAQLRVPLRELEPYECPECGERAVYQWWFCFECKYRFVPNLVRPAGGGPPHVPFAPACPNCKGNMCGAWVADDPAYQPAGEAELPKWP
jgi:hypothetical protein